MKFNFSQFILKDIMKDTLLSSNEYENLMEIFKISHQYRNEYQKLFIYSILH